MTAPLALRKRQLFEAWLAAHAAHASLVAYGHASLSRSAVLARVASLAGRQGAGEFVYVLVEDRAGEAVPACVGRTRDPLGRWAGHLAGLAKGEGGYARWKRRLLREGRDEARFDLTLYVVGQGRVAFPPVPDSPTTIECVAAQLVSLAADAYPLPLLGAEVDGRTR